MIGSAGSRHRRRRSSPGVHFAQAQQVARLAALNQRENGTDGADVSGADFAGSEFNQALARRRSSKYTQSLSLSLSSFHPLGAPTKGRVCG